MKTENPNKIDDFPTWQIPYLENLRVKKIKKYHFILNSKITHQESRLVKSISKILNILDQYENLNTTEIKIKTKLSWDSVTKSLEILKNKKIVQILTHDDRKNNEKKYQLIRDKAVCYHEHLSEWKFRDIIKNQWKQMFGITKIDINFKKLLSNDWYKIELILSKDDQERFHTTKKRVKIEELPIIQVRELGDQYLANGLCFECFEKNKIASVRIVQSDSGWQSVCNICGNEIEYDPNIILDYSTTLSREKMRKYKIDKQFKNIEKHRERKI